MSDKKVAVVSCYFKHNYGSMLQAYATQMALKQYMKSLMQRECH